MLGYYHHTSTMLHTPSCPVLVGALTSFLPRRRQASELHRRVQPLVDAGTKQHNVSFTVSVKTASSGEHPRATKPSTRCRNAVVRGTSNATLLALRGRF